MQEEHGVMAAVMAHIRDGKDMTEAACLMNLEARFRAVKRCRETVR